jgi:vancomycin permeability regulator SanA
VPEQALLVDRDGLRTFTSLRRARDVFALTRVVVVTNPFHMPRALFLARALGLSVTGVPAPERRAPRTRTHVLRLVREGGALTRAVVDVAWIRLRARDAQVPEAPR